MLEALDGQPGGRPVTALGVPRGAETERAQAPLDVGHGAAPVALGEREDPPAVYRYAASSWSSWPLGLAPTRRALASPSLNRIRVGMLITS